MRPRFNSPHYLTSARSEQTPKYTIGVVSELLGLPAHELRRYEKTGLLEPARQTGKNRLYSDCDVALLEELAKLAQEGVNAAGIRQIIKMRRHISILQQERDEARRQQQLTEVKLTCVTSLLFTSIETTSEQRARSGGAQGELGITKAMPSQVIEDQKKDPGDKEANEE